MRITREKQRFNTINATTRLVALCLAACMCVGVWRVRETALDEHVLSLELQNPLAHDGDTASTGIDKADIKPLDCDSLLEELKKPNPAVEDPNNGEIFSRLTDLEPRFLTSVHNKQYDSVRFNIIEKGHYYEKSLTAAFQKVLKDKTLSKDARVLDVGGNIGWFALLSASLGYHVDVFEPNLVNGIRICQSIQLNKWKSGVSESLLIRRQTQQGSVNFYPMGVGDVDAVRDMYDPPKQLKNPGIGTFDESNHDWFPPTPVYVITLDQLAQEKGWFDSQASIAILKIDVVGYESKVIKGARRLLESGMVKNIFMEAPGKTVDKKVVLEMYSQIIQVGYRLHATGKWMGPNKEYKHATNPDTAEWLVNDLVPNAKSSINLWWKLDK